MLALPVDQHLFAPLAALVSTLGTLLLRIVDHVFQHRPRAVAIRKGRRASHPSEADVTAERRELLDERIELRNRLAQAETLAADWREKYFGALQQVTDLKARISAE